MKHYLSIILFVCAFTINSHAISIGDSVAKAEKAYQEESYFEVISTYEFILATGQNSPDLFYNLGNAYFKNNQFAKAILNFERCLKLDPKHEDALFNLNIARLQQTDKITEIPEFFMLIWYKDFISVLHSNTWAYLSIFLFLFSLTGIYFYFFTSTLKTKKISFALGITFLLLTIVTGVFSYSLKQIQSDTSKAIIINPSLTVKSTPGDNGKNLFVIHEGLKVLINDTFNDWVKIKISNGNEGWVLKSDLERI